MNESSSNRLTDTTKNIVFIQKDKPGWESGDYTIKVTQNVSDTNGKIQQSKDSLNVSRSFSVFGERVTLNYSKIYSYFPAKGITGFFANCLPHIVFTSSTFPWQRNIGDKYPSSAPWLALLTFASYEAPQLKQVTLDSFNIDSLPDTAYDFKIEASSEKCTDTCNVIDISAELFKQIAPSADDLSYLAHVREVDITNKPSASNYIKYSCANSEPTNTAKFSVLIGNRLLKTPCQYTVHLVSLENMGDYLPNSDGKTSKLDGKSFVRLISLANWSFAVTQEEIKLSDIIKNLDRDKLDPEKQPHPSLQLPRTNDTSEAGKYFNDAVDMGYVPLKHSMRGGGQTTSWYRGPLVPYSSSVAQTTIKFPNESSDSLLRYNSVTGMFDISYSVAWQLGRLLGLSSKAFAQALYKWKRQNTQELIKSLEQQILAAIYANAIEASNGLPIPLEQIKKSKKPMKDLAMAALLESFKSLTS
jgi:hypothetical protein